MKKFLFLFILGLYLAGCTTDKSKKLSLDVTEVKLPNGFTALLIHRDGAPVFSAYLRIKVGNIEEPKGQTGLAHFFEHMAFKGTPTIGVKDFEAEKVILQEMHEVGAKLVELNDAAGRDEEIKKLKNRMTELEAEHEKVVERNEFVKIFQRNGGADLNATTSND